MGCFGLHLHSAAILLTPRLGCTGQSTPSSLLCDQERGPSLHPPTDLRLSSLPLLSLPHGQDQPQEKSLLFGFSISSLLLNCQSWRQRSLDPGRGECSHPLMCNDLCDVMWDRAGSSYWTRSMSSKIGQHFKSLSPLCYAVET